MKKKSAIFGIVLCFLCSGPSAWADDVYTIYPVPHEQIARTGHVSLSKKVNLVCESGIDKATLERAASILREHGLEVEQTHTASATQTNVFLGINGSGEMADKKASALGLDRTVLTKEGKFDRHIVCLADDNGQASLIVLGENTDATFIGLASVEQMLDGGTDALPCVTINDYADLQSRGLVEGYYGYPYTVTVKKDLMRFMMRYKMNTYMYGAKSDPYHSQYWKNAYPTTLTAEQEKNGWLSQDMIRDLTAVSAETKVNFIWAIHPGNDFTGSSTIINNIMNKYDMMYNLGVRQFAVFVDDVSVPGDAATHKLNATRLADLQKAIEKKYNAQGTAPADTVRPLHFVPQVYASAFVDAATRKSFFNALAAVPDYITIYTTGWGVWSVPNSSDLNVVKEDLGRNVAWWWNYPCNDNADGQLYPMDTYSNFHDMPAVDGNARLPKKLQNGVGIVCNPMQEGEVSKSSLFSVANYSWNNEDFDNAESWEASFKAILANGEMAAAYRVLCPYLRYNDPEELGTLIATYKSSLKNGTPAPDNLKAKLEEVLVACDKLAGLKDSETESDVLLYNDLAPWLLKLQQMASSAHAMLTSASMDDTDTRKWATYAPEVRKVEGLETEEAYKAYALEGMGNGISVSVRPSQPSELHLKPFVGYLKENALGDYFTRTSGNAFASNKEGAKGNVVSTNGTTYAVTPSLTLEKGEYAGITLEAATTVNALTVDEALLENFSLMYSTDGKSWKRISVAGEVPVGFVKHIVYLNEADEGRSLMLSKSKLSVSTPYIPLVAAITVPSGEGAENTSKGNITDGDLTTFFAVNKNQVTGDAYQLSLKAQTDIHDVRVYIGTKNGDYMNSGKVQVSNDGRTWTDLKVKGTNQTTFNINTPQVKPYAPEIKYCDFDGAGTVARYVRLYVANANTSKWLRLYEIEVNKQFYAANTEKECTDAQGNALPALTDGLGYTAMETTASSITYKLRGIGNLKKLIVYQDATAPAGNTVPATLSLTDDGENWTETGKLTEAAQEIDMSAHPQAKALRIAWSGTRPLIYEIVEVDDEDNKPVISAIVPIETTADMKISTNGKSLTLTAPGGIKSVAFYRMDGAQMQLRHFANEKNIQVPIPETAQGLIIAKIETTDKKASAYKLWVR